VTADESARPAHRTRPHGAWHAARQVLIPLASLKLTVVLFALSIFLVFLGTLAQIDYGLFTVLHKYFRALYVWIPFQLLVQFGQIFLGVPKSANVPGSFPYPGGWLLGGLLLVNLLAAHLVRFKVSLKRSGILLIHSGLAVMMLGELVTGLFAVEGRMTIPQGAAANFLEEHNAVELAVVDPSATGADRVVSVPASLLQKGGEIRSDLLPFDIGVVEYMANSQLAPARSVAENPATAGFGLRWAAIPEAEVSGVSQEQREEVPSAYLTFKDKGTGRPLGTYLVTRWRNYRFDLPPRPERVECGGNAFDVSLRLRHWYKPYTVQLLEFRHDVYPGTDIAKNYSSRVRLTDPSQSEDREVLISMNNPLRYRGDTFYQGSFLDGDRGTVLQVVRNPGWEMPYLSCLMVTAGMIVHFTLHLAGFLRRRAAA
jgi:hypothetical protein